MFQFIVQSITVTCGHVALNSINSHRALLCSSSDICLPLRVSFAALRALAANTTDTPSGLRPPKGLGFSAYQSFRRSRANLLNTQNKEQLKAVHMWPCIDFRSVWGTSREGEGIWRHLPPAGRVSLRRLCY